MAGAQNAAGLAQAVAQVQAAESPIQRARRAADVARLLSKSPEGFGRRRFGAAVAPNGELSRENFKRWFAGSKVVDANGEPLVLYRGGPATDWQTGADITEFRSRNGPWAAFLTSDKGVASKFAGAFGGGVISAVYAKITKPLLVDAGGAKARDFQIDASVIGRQDSPIRGEFLDGDYDGLIIKNTADEGDIYVPRKPEQIKSALGNAGNFDPGSASILDAVADSAQSAMMLQELAGKVREAGALPARMPGDADEASQLRALLAGQINDLRAALFGEPGDGPYATAHAYFKSNLQGKTVQTQAGPVLISGSSWREMKRGLKSDSLKAALIPHVEGILAGGRYEGRSAAHKERADLFVAFHFFVGKVQVGDLTVEAGVNVAERADGQLVYGLGHEFEPRWVKRDSANKKPSPLLAPGKEPGVEDGSGRVSVALDGILEQDGGGVNIVILSVRDRQGNRLAELEDGAAQPADGVLDSAAPNPMQRAKLSAQLAGKAKELSATDPKNPMQRARLSREVMALLAQLGPKAAGNPHVAVLADIAAGRRDSAGLLELRDLMISAVAGLEEAGLLQGDAEAAAHRAITHWAELEEKTNG